MSVELFPEWTPEADWVPVLVGPTAVGKTALALDWAERHGGEIISADSRQVYRGLDIGTAKPSPAELARVPHHFISELTLEQPFSAGQFARDAEARIRAIRERGRPVLVTGGSTLYVEALVHGLAQVPRAPDYIRERLNREAHTPEGARALFEQLKTVDPTAAATMDATKTQRVVRALEVWQSTGRTFSSYLSDATAPAFDYRVFVLNRDRSVLYERINQRVDQMIEVGLMAECAALKAEGYTRRINPLRTIGYQEPLSYLAGEIEYDAMVALLKRNSRRYAKRQLTWFRRRPEYSWIELDKKMQ